MNFQLDRRNFRDNIFCIFFVIKLLSLRIVTGFVALFQNNETVLSLTRIAGGVHDSQNCAHRQLKMAWSKNIFSPRSIHLKMFQNYILLQGFVKKSCFRWFFNQKVRASTCFWWLCIPAGWESYMTPRRLIGVRRRGWVFRVVRAEQSQSRRCQALSSWGSGILERVGQLGEGWGK